MHGFGSNRASYELDLLLEFRNAQNLTKSLANLNLAENQALMAGKNIMNRTSLELQKSMFRQVQTGPFAENSSRKSMNRCSSKNNA